MRNMPTKAPNRSPAAMHTRMRGGPPADWKSDEKPDAGALDVEAGADADGEDILESVGGWEQVVKARGP